MILMTEEKCCSECGEIDNRLEKVKEITEKFKEMKGALIPALHEVQKLFGYLPEEALQVVSQELNIPMSEIYGCQPSTRNSH
jgi:NADH:ubiquinone oxidoreductase subunit E